MIRRSASDLRPVHNTFQTMTAAADAIATVDHRLIPRATSVQKRRWGSWWSIYWCFGSLKQRKRIGHAVLSPSSAESHEFTLQSPDILPPFAAPPSSPVSFLQSDPPSATHSPTAVTAATPNNNIYSLSPDGPSSIFAIGPFAYETQLVSPPLNFSTLTTQPSTAPFTPPPESVHHLTTPSSPEVPFAQFLLQPGLEEDETDRRYSFPSDDFQSYHFCPGSPISHLISPRSVISRSGASSPLPDLDFASSGSRVSSFSIEVPPPTLLNLDKHSIHNWRRQLQEQQRQSYDFDLNPKCLESMSDHYATNESGNIQILVDGSQIEEPAAANHRFSFELSDEDALLRSVKSKPLESNELASASSPIHEPFERAKEASPIGDHISNGTEEKAKPDSEEANQHQEHHSITLGSVKEFNFDNGNGSDALKPAINSNWWANAKDGGTESMTTGAWSFFPMMQRR